MDRDKIDVLISVVVIISIVALFVIGASLVALDLKEPPKSLNVGVLSPALRGCTQDGQDFHCIMTPDYSCYASDGDVSCFKRVN